MSSFLGEIKEESSNVVSSKNSQPKQSARAEDEETKTVKSKGNCKADSNKQDVDPLELLGGEYEVVDQTVVESSDFQDTIIGSQYMMKFSSKGSRRSSKAKNKENKVPSLKIQNKATKYNNQVLSLDDNNDDMIDMLLSEEGEIKEEKIIQMSESSANKHPPVRIKKSHLVKVDPVERFQEVLRNSQRNNPEESSEARGKNKPSDYLMKNANDEESIKLDDLIGPYKHEDTTSKQSDAFVNKRRNQPASSKPKVPKFK